MNSVNNTLWLYIIIIIIINFFSSINCFLDSLRTRAIPWSWGTREVFYLMDRNPLSMRAVPRRMIFCSLLMLLAPGIFPKFWSIPSLIPSPPTITGTVSVLIPHILVVSISRSLYFESFSMTFIEVFQSDGTDTSISLQHWLRHFFSWGLFRSGGAYQTIKLCQELEFTLNSNLRVAVIWM